MGVPLLHGTNLSYVQAYNRRIALEVIRVHGPLSRTDIARHTVLTLPTISTIVQELIERKLVIETGPRQIPRGKPPIDLVINPDGAHAIGLALGRDRLTGVLVNLAGTILQRVRYDFHLPSPDEAIALMDEAARRLSAESGLPFSRLWGMGLGTPGPLDTRSGSVTRPANFPGWNDVPIVKLLVERTGLDVYLENNATAAAIGERWYGAGWNIRDFYYIFFGCGLGGGLILNGQPYRGFGGNAGGFGNTPLVAVEEGSPPKLRRLEEHTSLFGLFRVLKKAGIRARSTEELTTLYLREDAHLTGWLDEAARQLAPAIVNVENHLDPEAIILGGRLPVPLTEDLIERLNVLLPSFRLKGKPNHPKLMRAQAGEDSAALGVATLPIYEALAPSPDLLLKLDDASRVLG